MQEVHVCRRQLLIIYPALPAEHTSTAVFLSAYRDNVNIDGVPGELDCRPLFYDERTWEPTFGIPAVCEPGWNGFLGLGLTNFLSNNLTGKGAYPGSPPFTP